MGNNRCMASRNEVIFLGGGEETRSPLNNRMLHIVSWKSYCTCIVRRLVSLITMNWEKPAVLRYISVYTACFKTLLISTEDISVD